MKTINEKIAYMRKLCLSWKYCVIQDELYKNVLYDHCGYLNLSCGCSATS